MFVLPRNKKRQEKDMATTYCPECNKTHYPLMCYFKPRKPLHKIGPTAKKWIDTRKEWVKNNPPDISGYWYCTYCGVPLAYSSLTLDHIKARSRRPDLRYDHSNLAPSCYSCNQQKGSKDVEEFYQIKDTFLRS